MYSWFSPTWLPPWRRLLSAMLVPKQTRSVREITVRKVSLTWSFALFLDVGFIFLQIKLILIKILHETSIWNRGKRYLENGLLQNRSIFHLIGSSDKYFNLAETRRLFSCQGENHSTMTEFILFGHNADTPCMFIKLTDTYDNLNYSSLRKKMTAVKPVVKISQYFTRGWVEGERYS